MTETILLNQKYISDLKSSLIIGSLAVIITFIAAGFPNIEMIALCFLAATATNFIFFFFLLPRKLTGVYHAAFLFSAGILPIFILHESYISLNTGVQNFNTTLWFHVFEIFFILRTCRYINATKKHPACQRKSFLSYMLYPGHSSGFTPSSNALQAIEVIIEARKGYYELGSALRMIISNMKGFKTESELRDMDLLEFKDFLMKTDLGISEKDFNRFFDLKVA